MSGISSWILSITGIIIVTLLVEIILPNGKTNKLIKSIIAIFSIFVIISPLNKFDISSLNPTSIFQSEIQLDSNFIDNRNKEKVIAYEGLIKDSLLQNGYKNIKISLKAAFDGEKLIFENAFVDLRDLVLLGNTLNINKYTNIIAIIKKVITIEEEKIVFYE
ncbi:MAG: hypothetical protein IJW32_02560 [Clostridia bacterium]|nr:hypothetical protein [Clostridia bacterium]